MNKKLTLGDYTICPKCKSNNTYQSDTDEFEILEYNNTGHAYLDYYCKECKNIFRVCMEFDYEITKHWIG